MTYSQAIYAVVLVLAAVVLLASALAIVRAQGSREFGRLVGVAGFMAFFAIGSGERIVEHVRPPFAVYGMIVFMVVTAVFFLRRRNP